MYIYIYICLYACIYTHVCVDLLLDLCCEPPSLSGDSSWYFDCVDVGGGRGSLSLALIRALPRARVRVIDAHKPSIEALNIVLQQEKETERIRPIHADFIDLQDNL